MSEPFNLLEKIAPATYRLPREEAMRVPGLIIGTEALLQDRGLNDPLNQVRHVATLPGIVGYSIAMPDIHWGYGFPIGGIAAMDVEEGVISPGGVGYDINCGVRLALVPEPFSVLFAKERDRKALLEALFRLIPSGVGRGHRKGRGLSDRDYTEISRLGAGWSIAQGYGEPIDLEHTESNGLIEEASLQAVSSHALDRGRHQLGSIGSGNHFVEIGEVEALFCPETANSWGISTKQTYVLIHSGSRGFGHQVCQDSLHALVQGGYANHLVDRQLAAAPIHSTLGQTYFAGMALAANFAFNNRQQILHAVRQAFFTVSGIPPPSVRLLYDVCHNIAKFETHLVEGKPRRLCVHRKGATRAFGPQVEELSPLFQTTGQPVLVPGDMGRASHLMAGQGNPLTWASSCHGAGRARSRMKSLKAWKNQNLFEVMRGYQVEVMASSRKTIAEEMPDAYKDVDLVVEAVEQAQCAKRIARLKPHLVIKG